MNARPPGPTWRTDRRKKSFAERYREMNEGPIGFIKNRFETFGDLYFVKTYGKPTYVLRHPDHLHEVLVTRVGSFAKAARDLAYFLGQGLLTSNGELWRRQRRLIQPAFSRQHIADYTRVMLAHTQRMLERWRPGEERELGRDMMELTLSVVCEALLSHDASGETDAVAEAMTILQTHTGVFDPLPRWLPSRLHRTQGRAVKNLDTIIFRMIDRRAGESKGADLLSQLVHATDEEGSMSRTQLRDELVTMFLAGHETAALTMTWSFYLLSEHPAEEARLHEEVDRVLGGRPPSFEDLDALAHTRRIIEEAMRLYPPLYLLPRVASEDSEIGGYFVPKGSEILLWVYLTQRDARWFPDPDRFDPDRFLPDSGRILHPHAYLPFGGGQRACLGRHFAMAETQIILASIAQRFRLRRPGGPRVVPNPRVTLGPNPEIRMTLEARNSLTARGRAG